MKNNKIIAIISFIILCFTSSCTKENSSSSGNSTTPSIVAPTTPTDKTDTPTSSSSKELPHSPQELGKSFILMEEEDDTMTVTVTNPSSEGTKGFYSPDEVTIEKNITDYSYQSIYDWHYTPSTGKVPLLVIPVVIPGNEHRVQKNTLDIIKTAFFGGDDELNFESLHSYYYKSSYGQLDFTGLVTDFYYPKSNSNSQYKKSTDLNINNLSGLVKESVDWAKDTYDLNMADFDSDKDGTLDGVWIIYIRRVNPNDTSLYWAFTTTTSEVGTVDNPCVNTYGWAGLDFLTGDIYSEITPDDGCDGHVLIHETGHMLGLQDYYTYSSSSYSPLGRIDMMDNNAGDQNPYSKLLLGWIKPYVVTGNATITLKSDMSKDNVIVIPYDSKSYKFDSDGKLIFNPFDEYIVIDYYSPNGLNEKDYEAYKVQTVKDRGARVYHADARLVKLTSAGNDQYDVELPDDPDSFVDDTEGKYYMFVTNTESPNDSKTVESYFLSDADNSWDEIRWISANKNILDSYSDNEGRLFTNGSTFSLKDYKEQFVSSKFDNKESFSSFVLFSM